MLIGLIDIWLCWASKCCKQSKSAGNVDYWISSVYIVTLTAYVIGVDTVHPSHSDESIENAQLTRFNINIVLNIQFHCYTYEYIVYQWRSIVIFAQSRGTLCSSVTQNHQRPKRRKVFRIPCYR